MTISVNGKIVELAGVNFQFPTADWAIQFVGEVEQWGEDPSKLAVEFEGKTGKQMQQELRTRRNRKQAERQSLVPPTEATKDTAKWFMSLAQENINDADVLSLLRLHRIKGMASQAAMSTFLDMARLALTEFGYVFPSKDDDAGSTSEAKPSRYEDDDDSTVEAETSAE